MTDTDRIAQMAREAGLIEARDVWEALPKAYTDALSKLARLVAEDCAKWYESDLWWLDEDDVPSAIRARYK